MLITNTSRDSVTAPFLSDSAAVYAPKFNILNNYLLFSSAFSIAHATVDGVLIYATPELGKDLGAVSGGLLYIVYSVSALFVSRPTLRWTGAKLSIVIGMASMLMYVTTFMIALAVPSVKWYVCVPGAFLGGLGAGLMWPAQGSYYSQSAVLYAGKHSVSVEEAHINFAGYFATIYLGSEAVGKLLVTLIYLSMRSGGTGSWQVFAFLVYTVLAWLSTAAVCNIENIGCEHTTDDICHEGITKYSEHTLWDMMWGEALAVFRLVKSHDLFFTIVPYQLSFGFCAAFMSYYVDGIVLDSHGKEGYIGALSAFSIVIAAALAMPLATYVNLHGKCGIMITGAVCFGLCCSVVMYMDNGTIASWAVIIPLVAIFGAGRGIWESTNKAVVADLFINAEEDRNTAFAAIYFFSGVSAAAGFFAYRFMSAMDIGTLNVVISVISLVGNYRFHLEEKI